MGSSLRRTADIILSGATSRRNTRPPQKNPDTLSMWSLNQMPKAATYETPSPRIDRQLNGLLEVE